MFFLHLLDPSKANPGSPPSFFARQPASHRIPFRQLDVGNNLAIQLLIETPLAHQGQQTLHRPADRHDDSRNRATSAVAFSQFATSTGSRFRPARVSE